jgi:hypothetical protein
MKPQFTITETLVETDNPGWAVVRNGWLESAVVQFDAIASLPDGWDGEGASRPDRRSLEAGWELLTSLSRAEGVTKPHVNPTRSGGVQLEWANGPRYFEIEVGATRGATYLYRDIDAGREETGEIFEREPLHAIIEYIRRVGA